MNQKVKLFIHELFFDAFAQLPRNMQKKTREFMKKFREDPTSSAINYEKISSFSDQSLRTVRIDQKYRAIIKSPTKGDAYTLLWVDNHDEAMDWAKNKVFEWNEHTKAFQLYEKPPEEYVPKETRTSRLIYSFTTEQLQKIGTPASLIDSVGKLTSIQELETLKGNLPNDNFEYLYFLLEGIPYEDIISDIESGTELGADDLSDNAKRSVFAVTDDAQIEEYLNGDFDKWRVFLHPSQRSLAYGDFNGVTKILGGAGTGKTVCAIHRLKYLSSKLGPYDCPILFTTYTKSLSRYLDAVVKTMDIDPNTFTLLNFDKLVFQLAKDLKVIDAGHGFIFDAQEEEIWLDTLRAIPSSRDQLFLKEEYNEVILKNLCTTQEEYLRAPRIGRSVRIGRRDKMEIWEQVQEFRNKKGDNYTKNELCNLLYIHLKSNPIYPFSSIICDELQDFSTIELRLMRAMVEEKSNDLFFVGDPYQNIYNRKINFSEAGISVRGRRSKKLKVNYRTTEEIKKFAVSVLRNSSHDDFDGASYDGKGYVSLISGVMPEYAVFSTPEEECTFVKQKLTEVKKSFKDSEICIAARTHDHLNRMKIHLTNDNIPFDDLGKEGLESLAIKTSTFHNLKGHEFKVLFLVGVAASTVPFINFPQYQYFDELQRVDYENSEKSLLYVAISRAIHFVYMSGVGEGCKFI